MGWEEGKKSKLAVRPWPWKNGGSSLAGGTGEALDTGALPFTE